MFGVRVLKVSKNKKKKPNLQADANEIEKRRHKPEALGSKQGASIGK